MTRAPLLLASQWHAALGRDNPASELALTGLYGRHSPAVETSRRRLRTALERHIACHGDHPVLLARAPGRVNVMGRHVDHQGGHVNTIAIDRDVWLVAGPRDDRRVVLDNVSPDAYPDRAFTVDEVVSGGAGRDWRTFVDSDAVTQRARVARGDWVQYVRAGIARVCAEWPDAAVPGVSLTVDGNIPVASGLSSSSALVVATMEAVTALCGIGTTPERFVELCGEAEWYVGTRGGAGDHAAMKLARPGHVVQVGFYPFGATDVAPFPHGFTLLVCNSLQEARKTGNARDVFNQRVACYHLGRELVKGRHAIHAPRIEHLRDVTGQRLGVEREAVVRMLAALPREATRAGLRGMLPDAVCDQYFANHAEPSHPYDIRGVVLFGLAECERSRRCRDLLHAGDLAAFGQWMRISHDGDRVSRTGRDGQAAPWTHACDDQAMERLAQCGGDLAQEPGAYACSTPRLDRMVDVALEVDGVMGAQMAGAGLGGCMMALVRDDAVDALRAALTRGYYEPLCLEPQMLPARPVGGSGVLAL